MAVEPDRVPEESTAEDEDWPLPCLPPSLAITDTVHLVV